MSESRTFTLVGNFQDNISPALENVNRTLATLRRSLASMSTRKSGFAETTKSIGSLVSAHKHLANAVKEVRAELNSTIPALKDYRKEIGKAASANIAIRRSMTKGGRGDTQYWQNLTSGAREYGRTLDSLNRRGRGGGGGGRPPRPPSGGGGHIEPPSRSGGRRGGMGAEYAAFSFSMAVGQGLAAPITSAIVSGFQMGVGLMTKPFEYFAGAFQERIQDELSDLKAAGGLYSISKRSKNPFLANIDEAIQFQQDTNETFAKLAGALPGVTNDYVQVGKRLSDTAARVVQDDFGAALKEANRIRSTEEGRKFYGGEIKGTGPEAQRETIETLLGELTKKTTIAGLGGRSGAGGIAGAYGLPGLVERMISQEEVSMGQFQRYAAVFSDPTVADALARNVDDINKTSKNSLERYKALQKLLDEVVTPELVEKLRVSVDGIYQGFRSTILDPDTGLFGLGRNFKKIGKKLNSYGQYVNAAGKVVDDISQAADEDLSLFEILRDVFSNIGQALLPIAEALPTIFDPLKSVANILMDARHYAAEFNRTFNMYRNGLLDLSKIKGNEFLKDSVDVRASLSAVSNFLYQFGAIGKGDFESYGKQLLSKNLNVGNMISTLVDKLLNSEIAYTIGEFLGTLIGTVISQVARVTGFISGKLGGNKLTGGFFAGFKSSGGEAAIRQIFSDIFTTMFKLAVQILPLIPWQVYALAAAAIVVPAALAGLSMSIAMWFTSLLEGTWQNISTKLTPSRIAQSAEGAVSRARSGNLFTSPGSMGATRRAQAYTRLQRMRARKYLTEPVTQRTQLIRNQQFPMVALGEEKLPFTRAQQAQRAAQAAARIPGRIGGAFSRVGGAAMGALGGAGKAISGAAGGAGRAIMGLPGMAAVGGAFGKIIGPLSKFGGLLSAVTKNFGSQFMGAFKGVAGKFLIFGGILTTIISLFQGKGLAESLAEGAGPTLGSVLGGILGTALIPVLGPLGPLLGSMIGGWIGSLEIVTQPLTSAFGGLIGSVEPLLGLIGQIFNDIGGLVNGFISGFLNLIGLGDKLGKGFNLLQFALFALLSPFKLLQIGILGIYELYLTLKSKIPGLGLTKEEQARLDKVSKDRQRATDELTIEGRQALGKTLTELRAEEYKKFSEARRKGDVEAQNASARFMKVIEEKIRSSGQPQKQPPPRSGQPGAQGGGAARTTPTSTPTIPSVVGRPGFLTLGGKTFWRGTDGSLNPVVGGVSPTAPAPAKGGAPTPAPAAAASQVAPAAKATAEALTKASASGNTLSSTINTRVIATLNSLANAFDAGKKKIEASLAQQVATYAKIVSSWEKSNVTSQAKLSASASSLATAINNAAAKIRSASAGIGAAPSAAPTGTEPRLPGRYNGINSSNRALPVSQAIALEERKSGGNAVIANDTELILNQDQQKKILTASEGLNLGLLAGGFDKFTGALGGLAKMAEAFGGLGGAQGSLGATKNIASRFGLIMTSYLRTWPQGSYHTMGRAMDFGGDPSQMLQFARYMASTYGGSITELIHTPLGFGIKNRRKVAPYAASSHYDHVHVAYGLGAGNPAFFSSAAAADRWEGAMARKEPIVSSVRATASEVGKGPITVNAPITINQQPGQDSDALASLVVMKLSMEIDRIRNSTA